MLHGELPLLGDVEGEILGLALGCGVVGDAEGLEVGEIEGDPDGEMLGLALGVCCDGDTLGLAVTLGPGPGPDGPGLGPASDPPLPSEPEP